MNQIKIQKNSADFIIKKYIINTVQFKIKINYI